MGLRDRPCKIVLYNTDDKSLFIKNSEKRNRNILLRLGSVIGMRTLVGGKPGMEWEMETRLLISPLHPSSCTRRVWWDDFPHPEHLHWATQKERFVRRKPFLFLLSLRPPFPSYNGRKNARNMNWGRVPLSMQGCHLPPNICTETKGKMESDNFQLVMIWRLIIKAFDEFLFLHLPPSLSCYSSGNRTEVSTCPLFWRVLLSH